jgi:dihydrofolate synthase/folylpolyglutamate synthase
MTDAKSSAIATDADTLSYLTGLMANGMRLDLAPFVQLLDHLGRPHLAYNTILVGGTNGKGSVASMIAAILRQGGFRVGLYTSPHLVDVRERITINGAMITPEAFADVVAVVRSANAPGLTYFECLTAAAFLHFQRQRVDLAVLEVGMGGRLDATNVAAPLLSVITNITLEHTQYLGHCLRDIAMEKAGIIREKGVCLTSASQPVVRQTLRNRCRDLGATLLELGRDFKLRRGNEKTFSIIGAQIKMEGLKTALPGSHQERNAALAVAAVEVLSHCGYYVAERDVRKGLSNVRWPGRLEVVATNPTVILDGAHNPAAISVLCNALKHHFPRRKLIVIFGVLQDKNYRVMIKKLAPLTDILILTTPDTERAVMPEDLKTLADDYCSQTEVIAKPADALRRAQTLAAPDDLICAAGSLYLVGDIKGVLAGTPVHHQ